MKYEVGDVIKFTQIDIFEYEDNEMDEIKLESEYIIADMFENLVVFTDGDIEFVLDKACFEFVKKIRNTKFTVGEFIKFENITKTEIPLYTNIKEGETYKIIDVTIDENAPIIHDGEREVVLYVEELLHAKRVNQKPKQKRKPKTPKKLKSEKDFIYIPFSKEMEDLQKDVALFSVTTLIDKALDERDFDTLKKIVDIPYLKLNNEYEGN